MIEAGPVSPKTETRGLQIEIAEGDLTRAYIEWLSLLRHISHAPDDEWPRWIALKKVAAELLHAHESKFATQLRPRLPALTPKQKHERPKHWIRRSA